MHERPGESKGTQLVMPLIALALIAPVITWIAYGYERFSGMTFVFGRGGGRGHALTPAHLAATYHGAIGSTVVGVALALILLLVRRMDRRRSGR